MPRLLYSQHALEDMERMVEFLLEADPDSALQTYDLVESALLLLTKHPLIGRAVEHDLRELVISRGTTGYIALYRYHELRDEIIVLAVRHQREAEYTEL